MTLYPEVQQKAQAEIDAVVGGDRLPTFQDRDRHPYINALCSEILRWLPVAPLGRLPPSHRSCLFMADYPEGVPHRLTEEDVYEGYFLPKGSIVIVNNWYADHSLLDCGMLTGSVSPGNCFMTPRRITTQCDLVLSGSCRRSPS